MKKAFALLLILGVLFSFAGCKALDYQEALELYNAGELAAARDLFLSLGDYADSVKMAEICSQQVDYAQAESWYAAGDYRQALNLYEKLGMYMDSPVKAIDCKHQIGIACIENGAYEEAISWLEPLGNYQSSQQLVQDAKWLWLHDAIARKGGILQAKADSGVVYLRAQEDGSVVVAWENQGYVLGMPFESHLTMTVIQGQYQAEYEALYTSTSTSNIREEVTGRIDLAGFTAATELSIDSFTQTKTEPDGTELTSTDTKDALMMQGILMEGRTAIAQCLPGLLEQTGVDMSLTEFGFDALDKMI